MLKEAGKKKRLLLSLQRLYELSTAPLRHTAACRVQRNGGRTLQVHQGKDGRESRLGEFNTLLSNFSFVPAGGEWDG